MRKIIKYLKVNCLLLLLLYLLIGFVNFIIVKFYESFKYSKKFLSNSDK